MLLASWPVLSVWFILVLASEAILLRDLFMRNRHLGSLMKAVWLLTVLYSGPVGLLIYWFSGRKEIPEDSDLRRGWRSVAHCYSGCGGGEVAGIIIAVGLLSLGTLWVAVLTFALAYVAGYALTVGPLLQDGLPLLTAVKDALYSETASITVMEVTAISLDLWLAGSAGMGDPRFWSSLIISLSAGLLAAWPINVLLIKYGVKEGMHNPKHGA